MDPAVRLAIRPEGRCRSGRGRGATAPGVCSGPRRTPLHAMRVLVNGVQLYFDVEGSGLVPDGPAMREKPTLVLLHGGPGFDHSIYKPLLSSLADIAQVVFLTSAGTAVASRVRGRAGPWASGGRRRAFCEVLGIARPIVLGMSFGGRWPWRMPRAIRPTSAKLILGNTEAAGGTYRERRVALFERFGGRRSGPWPAIASSTGTPTKRRSRPGCAWPFPSTVALPRGPDVKRRAVRHPRGHALVHPPGGGAHLRFSSPPFLRSAARPSCWAGKKIP